MNTNELSPEKSVALLDYLAKEVGCACISDLFYLNDEEKKKMSLILAEIPPDSFPLKEWSEAAVYLVKVPAPETIDAARELLIARFSEEQDR